MRVVATRAELADATSAARANGELVGFVPTMGALHAGHRALVAAARRETGFVVVSIFVNPLQFGPHEDLATYPRDLERDLAMLTDDGADLAFVPSEQEIWPRPPLVRVSAGRYDDLLEGVFRPGHLDGAATVVAKLLHLVGSCLAYFGRKDAQQLAVVRRMVADLAFPVEVVACDTVREPDGLAASSRNAYLTPEQRTTATVLYQALSAGRTAFRRGTTAPAAIEAAVQAVLDQAPGVEVQYVALADQDTFEAPTKAASGQVLALAARVGSTRLIDNVIL